MEPLKIFYSKDVEIFFHSKLGRATRQSTKLSNNSEMRSSELQQAKWAAVLVTRTSAVHTIPLKPQGTQKNLL